MKEKVREKYKALLSKEREAPKAQLDEREFCIGYLLQRERKLRNITIEDAAEGICRRNTLYRMEQNLGEENRKFACYFLVRSILMRMGMSVEKFEFYYDRKEERHEAIREWLVAWRSCTADGKNRRILATDDVGREIEFFQQKTEFWKELALTENASYEQALAAYQREYHTVWERMWVCWQQRIYELLCDRLPEEIEKVYGELQERKLFYIREEWEFLYALAAYWERNQAYVKANEVYIQMYRNAVMSGMDDERQLEILPEFCLVYGKFLHGFKKRLVVSGRCRRNEGAADRTEAGKALQGCEESRDKFNTLWTSEEILLYGIHLNRRYGRAYFLYELMEVYCTVLYEQWQEEKDNLEVRQGILEEMMQYEQYLTAWEVAQGKHEEARKRLIFMKGKIGWEGLTLEHTYDVLARQQD